jgi:chromate transport protein ChrA
VTAHGRRLEIFRFFLWLGSVGFGGPSAHIALMKEHLVERRRWVDERRFLDLVGASNLIPGPTSSALAIHLGYERAGVVAGLLAGLGFYSPAFVMVLGLSWLYRSFGASPVRTDLLAGVQAVIPAVILLTLWRSRSRGSRSRWPNLGSRPYGSCSAASSGWPPDVGARSPCARSPRSWWARSPSRPPRSPAFPRSRGCSSEPACCCSAAGSCYYRSCNRRSRHAAG